MAGIHVSGGVYSGSGDVTADWLYLEYHSAGTQKVWLPDGTLTLTSEKSNYALRNDWCGSSDNWQHQNGTVKITHGGNTSVYLNGAGPVVTGRDGQLYNLIINQNSNPRGTDPVYINTVASSGFYTVIENSLHIISGTARIGDTDVTNYTKLGHIFIGASGTFSAGNVVNVNNGGYNNWDSSGSIYAKTVIFSGTNSVFVGNGGTITFTGPYAGNDSDHYVWENPTLGTYYHNSGTIQLGGGTVYGPGETSEYDSYMNWKNIDRPADGTGQSSNGDGGWFYNVSGGFRDQGSGDRHLGVQVVGSTAMKVANNFSLMSGASIDSSTYHITVSGTVFLDEDAYWGDYGTQGGTKTIGALSMANGGNYFKAPTGSLTINNQASDGYKFRIENNGTFVHNDGTIVLDASTNGGSYKNTGSNGKYLYNLTVKNDTASARAVQHVYGVTVANDLIVSGAGSDAASWDVGFYNAGDGGITVSGTATVVSGAKLGRSIQDNTFGKLILGKKGWFDASSGTTTLQGAAAGSDRTKILQTKEDSLFTHNSGTVDFSCATGGLSTAYIWLDGKATADPFWDTTFNGDTGIHAYTWYKFYAGSSGVITFEGDTAKAHNGSAVFELGNSSTFQLGRTGASMLFGPMNWFYGQGSSTNLIKSVDTTYPAYISGTSNNKLLGTSGDSYTPVKTILQDIKLDDLEGDLKGKLHLSGQCEIVKDLTVAAGGVLTVESGQRATFGGTMTFAASGMIVSGALVNMEGASNWSETGYQPHIGRATATLMWNSTGYYSPNGGYLNNGWKNVFWNADARINQDGVFRNSNLIVSKGFDANNRPLGSTSESQMLKSIRVLNGGTVSSSTNTFRIQNTGTFNTRGGFFTSSSAFAFASSSASLIDCGSGSSIANIFNGGGTIEAWVKTNGDGASQSARVLEKSLDWRVYSDNGTASKMEFTQYFNGGKYQYQSNDRVLTNGKWHHIAMTYDSSDNANNATLYIDGEIKPITTSVRTGSNPPTDDSSIDLIIGNRAAGDKTWDGDIAMVRFWGDVRSATEIRNDMFNQYSDMIDKTNLMAMWQFDEGEGTTLTDVSTSGNTGTITIGTSAWATAGNWNANTLSGAAHTGKLYIGTGADPTVFSNSTFEVSNRELISGSKFVSKAHKGTDEYYIATSGANDYLNYTKLSGAPIGVASEVKVLATGSKRSYFNFDSTANNEQCHTLVNAGYVRIVNNSDFYTQDFDNSQGVWVRDSTYGGTIHDDGSTPHEYEPIDIIDDIDSPFDREELID